MIQTNSQFKVVWLLGSLGLACSLGSQQNLGSIVFEMIQIVLYNCSFFLIQLWSWKKILIQIQLFN
ncbi:hypothetical protein BpHYR1_033185 [Brachionus plicatilis]|uniref:Uncharacterized protein n=1 Tax=Brachionus plicatilis TaxID=10195 RepID=A0A3M7QDJ0_BRAPC|nr:hypothetical protein BpHYR1_033185 [Brachionus plicatilis]